MQFWLNLQLLSVACVPFSPKKNCSTSSPLVVQGNPQLDSKSSHVWRSLLCTAASLPGVGTAGIKWLKVLLFQDMQKEYTLAPAYHCFPQKISSKRRNNALRLTPVPINKHQYQHHQRVFAPLVFTSPDCLSTWSGLSSTST